MRPLAALIRPGTIQAALSAFFFLCGFSFSPVAGAGEIQVGTGVIIGIERANRTVMVEVPFDHWLYTVGGTLAPGAVLNKAGAAVSLDAFRVGDRVTIGWRRAHQGHEIVSIEAASYSSAPKRPRRSDMIESVIGTPGRHIIKKKETLLDIARQYDLGFNEMADLYPGVDPWVLPEGMALIIPSQWVLPETKAKGILINVAELRLYYFTTEGSRPRVMTFPIGIGDRDWPTPLGLFKVQQKRKQPTWYIPPSLRKKYGVAKVPPGPDNPLGDYWIGIGRAYGIHGSDIPWSVGRLVTHGCIRLYPEDIDALFKVVGIGTPVRIIYEPVKIGLLSGRVYMEAHRDVYGAIDDFTAYGYRCLNEEGLAHRVDMDLFQRVLDIRNGMPVDVTRKAESRE